jgi:hypothetical protein
MNRARQQRPWSWDRHQWSQPTTADVAYRRAGGRRRRNAEQQLAKAMRRNRLLAMMYDPQNPLGFVERGWQTRAARTLGVDRATVCRDLDALLGEMFGAGKIVGMGFELRITCRFVRALLPTPAEKRIDARLGLMHPLAGQRVS